MARCRNVRWPAVLLVWFVAVVLAMLVWLIRSAILASEQDDSDCENPWAWDAWDWFFGGLIFILVTAVGVIIACPFKAATLTVMTNTPYSSALEQPMLRGLSFRPVKGANGVAGADLPPAPHMTGGKSLPSPKPTPSARDTPPVPRPSPTTTATPPRHRSGTPAKPPGMASSTQIQASYLFSEPSMTTSSGDDDALIAKLDFTTPDGSKHIPVGMVLQVRSQMEEMGGGVRAAQAEAANDPKDAMSAISAVAAAAPMGPTTPMGSSSLVQKPAWQTPDMSANPYSPTLLEGVM